MKRCPQCNRVESDATLRFCRLDGASLITAPLTESESATMTLTPSPPSQETTTSRLRAINSIAVLPFANINADAENEFFCDGLAEELLNALAKVDGLKVTARTSSFSFKGKQVNVDQIGRTLRVNTILEGSVRRAGDRLRITVQLINAADSYQFDGPSPFSGPAMGTGRAGVPARDPSQPKLSDRAPLVLRVLPCASALQ
jgi:TolB-like protein